MTATSQQERCILATLEGFVAYQDPSLPSENLTEPPLEATDFVHAFVFNECGEALVLESVPYKRAWSSWQMLGCSLVEGDDPITIVQNLLQQRAGYVARQWLYLGTFAANGAQQPGVNHFFVAYGATAVAPRYSSHLAIKWVQPEQIKQALLDGRIAQIHHAAAASLALLLCG